MTLMDELETKAKEYVDMFYSYDLVNEEILFKKVDIRVAYKQGFMDAIKWYYPSKEEYPTEKNKQYLCKVKDCREVWYEVVDWDDFWLLNKLNQVVAWQYINIPKEEI